MGGRPALEGTTVLELSSGIPGAYCGRLLAMLGADVVKVESADRPDEARAAGTAATASSTPRSARWPSTSPTPAGAALLERLVADADVVLDDGALGRAAGRAGPLRRAARRPSPARHRRRSRRTGSTARGPAGCRPS